MWLAEKVGNVYRHPYDLGVYENLVSVRIWLYFFESSLFTMKRLFDGDLVGEY